MPLYIALLGGPVRALGAAEGLGAGVYAGVDLQILGVIEPLGADRAGVLLEELPLPGVGVAG